MEQFRPSSMAAASQVSVYFAVSKGALQYANEVLLRKGLGAWSNGKVQGHSIPVALHWTTRYLETCKVCIDSGFFVGDDRTARIYPSLRTSSLQRSFE
jgi:hypothetical protein